MASPALNEKDLSRPDYKYPISYPSSFCDPRDKLKEYYSLQTVKALYYNNWNVFQNAYGNTERSRFIDSRNWSNGKFDVQSFIGGKKDRKDGQKNPLMKHIDFDPVTEQSKYRDIIVGYLEDLDFEVTATTINPIAIQQKQDKINSELAILKMKQMGISDQLNQAAGTQITPESKLPFNPQDENAVKNYYQLGGDKIDEELEIEVGNEVVNNDSDWKSTKKMLLEDAFDTGRMIIDIVYEKDGRIRKKYVDPVNCGVEDYRGHGLARPSRIWYIELKTVQQILMESEGQFTYAQMKALAEQFENKFGNPVWNAAYQGWQSYVNTDTTYAYFFYNWKVPVMRCYWEELDIYKVAKETFSDGTYLKRWADWQESPAKYQMPEKQGDIVDTGESNPQNNSMPIMVNKDIEQMQYHRYYQASWIINTDLVYDYGRVPFQARDPYNTRYALCPLKYYRITQQPFAERIKPYVKKIYMGWQRIDNEVAHKKPSGWEMNVNALENIQLSSGETFTVKHNIEMWNETGSLLSKPKPVGDMFGQNREDWTVRPIGQQYFVEAITGHQAYINMCEDRIIKLTGINEFMDATNPNAQQSATAAKAALQGSKNSISQMASALLYISEKSAIDVSERLRLVVAATGDYGGYSDTLGEGLISSVTPKVIPHRYAIKVQAKPTFQERQEMKQWVAQAFSNMATPDAGGLWVSAVIKFNRLIDRGVNLSIIELMMESEQKKALDMLHQQKIDLINQQVAGNKQMQADSANQKLTAEQESARLQMVLTQFNADQQIRVNQSLVNDKTNQALLTASHKSGLKSNEEVLKSQLPQ